MKTNPIARRLVRVRLILTLAAIAAVAMVEFGAGRSLAGRIGQTTSRTTQTPNTPGLTLDNLMATAR